MELQDFIQAETFEAWAQQNLDHNDPRVVERVVTRGADEGLMVIAETLADSAISTMQALAVLVALDLYLQDNVITRKGNLLEFAPPAQRT